MRLLAILAILMAVCWLYTAETRLYEGNGDTFTYMYAAQTFAEGRGFLSNDFHGDAFAQSIVGPPDSPLATFPPFYPFLLALMGGGLQAARMLNAMGLFASLALGWGLMRIYGVPLAIRVGTCAAYLVFVNDWSHLYTSAMSETVFIPVFLAWMIVLGCIQGPRSILLLSTLAAVMALTRYIGLPFIVIGAAWAAYQQGWKAGALSLVIPILTVGTWLMRNYFLTGKFMGHTLLGVYSWLSVYLLATVIAYWAALVIVCSSLAACLWACWHWWSARIQDSSSSADSSP
jgi:hypothetical protein